jgi:hypothetical protein
MAAEEPRRNVVSNELPARPPDRVALFDPRHFEELPQNLMRTLLFYSFTTAALCLAQYDPPTQVERLKWAAATTAGPATIAGGAITSAYSTWRNKPPEYGPHWDGWGKRQALRIAGASTSNFMEAELGALWGEDPRYRRTGSGSVKKRSFHAIKSAFIAYDRKGQPMPAYARYAAVTGSNLIGNTWRPDSQHTARETSSRIYVAFLSRIASNAFEEFWPDIRAHLRRH